LWRAEVFDEDCDEPIHEETFIPVFAFLQGFPAGANASDCVVSPFVESAPGRPEKGLRHNSHTAAPEGADFQISRHTVGRGCTETLL
jgi:hypothetical protein